MKNSLIIQIFQILLIKKFMIVILSPAKTLDFEKTSNFSKHTIPIFLEESTYLISELKKRMSKSYLI